MAKATTVAEGLTRINDAKEAIRQAIVDTGVPCDTSVKLEDYPDKVAAITAGLDDAAQNYIGLLSGSLTSITIPAAASGSLRSYALAGMDSLVSADFGETVAIPDYCCYENSSLESVSAINVKSIGEWAFCSCLKINNLVFPALESIGLRAFSEAGKNIQTEGFSIVCASHCDIGTWAFENSGIKEISGSIGSIGSQAFNEAKKLKKVRIDECSSVGASAFYRAVYVEDFYINPDVVIGSLGNSSFRALGAQRDNKNSVKFVFDFRKSTFPTVPASCFQGLNTSYYCENEDILLPPTVTSIEGSAFQYTRRGVRIYLNSAPTLANVNAFNNTDADVLVVVAPEYINTLTAMTNWSASSVISHVIGGGKGYESGTTLPEYTRAQGYAISWYSDTAKTVPATVSQGAEIPYYCDVGTTRIVWFVNKPTLKDAAVVITDGVNIYDEGDPIPVGTSVTITVSPTDQNKNVLKFFIVNGVTVSGSNTTTVTMDQDLEIKAKYWDGAYSVSIDSILDNNTWETLKAFSKEVDLASEIPSSWLGTTKDFTYLNGTYKARLVDTTGKHTRVSDGSKARLLFEVTEINPTAYAFNSSGSNTVADSPLLKSFNNTDGTGARWLELPSDLRAVLEDVNVLVSPAGTGTTTPTNLPFKVFFGREADLLSSRSYSVAAEFDAITQDEYYQSNNTNAARQKYKAGTTDLYPYLLMSPFAGSAEAVCSISTSGTAGTANVRQNNRVVFRFAL